jgi:hypothetical protein
MQYLGLRGICYVELSVETALIDVHSGLGGSIFPNAAWRLTWALSTLKGPDERIRIPGWYDDIVPPTARDRELMSAQPDLAEEYKGRYGVKEFLNGLTGGLELAIAEVFEPTCTICGLTSGYQGPGSKTVLPARSLRPRLTSASSKGRTMKNASNYCASTSTPRDSPMFRSNSWAAARQPKPTPTTPSSNWWSRQRGRSLRRSRWR